MFKTLNVWDGMYHSSEEKFVNRSIYNLCLLRESLEAGSLSKRSHVTLCLKQPSLVLLFKLVKSK